MPGYSMHCYSFKEEGKVEKLIELLTFVSSCVFRPYALMQLKTASLQRYYQGDFDSSCPSPLWLLSAVL